MHNIRLEEKVRELIENELENYRGKSFTETIIEQIRFKIYDILYSFNINDQLDFDFDFDSNSNKLTIKLMHKVDLIKTNMDKY